LEAATRRGISHLALMGQAPHYLQGTENPAVLQALLAVVTRVLDLGLDVACLISALWDKRRTICKGPRIPR
jgi:proteasome assembly chaperone (PAC2) family protein